MKNNVRNDVSKRPKLPKPAAPVRAWIPFHKRGTFESEVRDAIYAGSFHEKRQEFANPDYTCRPVGLYDPRTHRAVPRKKAKKGGG